MFFSEKHIVSLASHIEILTDVSGTIVQKIDHIGPLLRAHSPNIVPNIKDICRIRTKCQPENISFETLASTSSGTSTVKRDTETSVSNFSVKTTVTERGLQRYSTTRSTLRWNKLQTTPCTVRCLCTDRQTCDTTGLLFLTSSRLFCRPKSVYAHSSFVFLVLFTRVTLPVRLRTQHTRTRSDKSQVDILSLSCKLLVRC